MTRRKPRATPRTVQRWLREGIPERTWEKLVDELAPSPSTARRWRREGVIPEARLREIKPPAPRRAPPPPPPRRPEPPRAKAKPARPVKPAPTTRRERVIEKWIDDGIPEDVFERVIEELAPDEDVAEQWREEEAIPVARLRRLEKIPRPRRPKPTRFVPPPAAPLPVLTREQVAGMKALGLTEAQIAASGVPETDEQRDARLEREAIQVTEGEVEPEKGRPVTPLEIEQAKELARLTRELERAQRMIEGPPPELPPEKEEPGKKEKPFRFDTSPRADENDEQWLERIGEQLIREARKERPGESAGARGERIVHMIRTALDTSDGEQLMDLVADVVSLEGGMNVRDVYTLFYSPGTAGRAA